MTTLAETKPFLTIADIARIMQVDKRTVIRWIGEGVNGRRLQAVKVGNTTRVRPEWFDRFLEGEEPTP